MRSMSYSVETTLRFEKEFQRLDRYTQQIVKAWITKRLINCEDPRAFGKALKANRVGQWRYRIGNYRLICEIEDNKLIILALSIGHRNNIYK